MKKLTELELLKRKCLILSIKTFNPTEEEKGYTRAIFDVIRLIEEQDNEDEQTAVDYLFEQLWETPKDKFNWYEIKEKAKKLERYQIIDAIHEGIDQATYKYRR